MLVKKITESPLKRLVIKLYFDVKFNVISNTMVTETEYCFSSNLLADNQRSKNKPVLH